MKLHGLLPVGTVVSLKDDESHLMIAGLCQFQEGHTDKLWQYAGVPYPQGFLGANRMRLFNGDQIGRVYALGYQDEEQFAFMDKLAETVANLKAQRSE